MKLFKTLDRCMESIGVVLSLVMVAVIFMQVVFRYCLNNALPWPEEMARYLFIWISYLGVAVCMGDDSHLRVTVIPDMFSKRTKKYIDILCMIINAAFFFISFVLGVNITIDIMEMEQTAISMPLPIWIVWAGIPICFIITCIQSIRVICRIIIEMRREG